MSLRLMSGRAVVTTDSRLWHRLWGQASQRWVNKARPPSGRIRSGSRGRRLRSISQIRIRFLVPIALSCGVPASPVAMMASGSA